jgi:hypothetical protein
VEDVFMAKWTLRFVVLSAFLLASASAYAHHSLAGVYALGKESTVTGAFKAFRLVNPHSTMKIDVKGKDGKTVEWTFVGGSVQAISRLGLKEGPNALKPGDEITVTIVPTGRARSGCCRRSPTPTATRFASARPTNRQRCGRGASPTGGDARGRSMNAVGHGARSESSSRSVPCRSPAR